MANRTLEKVIPYIVLSFIGIVFLLPLLWILFSSFDPHATVSLKIPKTVSVENFASVLADKANQQSLLIGVFLSLGQAIITVVAATLAAYPLSRYQLKYKKPFLLTILFMTSLPITAVMVPVYQLFMFLNLHDSLLGTMLFLASSSLPYAIWMTKNFMDAVPLELEESAWIDGASVLKGLQKVVAPLMIPGICTVAIFTFTLSWGNFFVPYILIQSPEKLPASVTIYQFFGQYGMVEYGKLAAFSLIYTIPPIVLYTISQRFMSEGFSFAGATKG
ncbi:sugar ABC transporter permease [Geobacillus sp. 46C-IIa]|uniref:carbohydrate ABC transporter permease n=1 Tax=Geobacillus sp. 46C-IIa TaxID=1963025 RepID=UPI0009BEF815|nr:carbohydrate ABC transporter permease [Geobacillus sp. 46C-IIa]OQP06228.1 sugar ABC transporter permease [Geobacillus sp. 46C-IIa]QNU29317.1 carbohydrate ABC transporter permease [Geobacillus sp. 46C-IIa]